MSYLGIFGLEFENNIVIFDRICLIGKFYEIIKIPNFGNENA